MVLMVFITTKSYSFPYFFSLPLVLYYMKDSFHILLNDELMTSILIYQ